MRSESELRRTLERIDGRGYKAYLDLRGSYALGPLELHVDHVQGDPFAAPSRVRLRVSFDHAELPEALLASRVQRVALADHLARRVHAAIGGRRAAAGSGKSGLIAIDAGGQQVLERTAIALRDGHLEARLEVGLPAAGRRVLGREAEALLLDALPRVASEALRLGADADEARRFVECVEDAEALRQQLDKHGLVAFVADGAILPRDSGASDRPLRGDAVPFRAPDSLRVTLQLAHARAGESRDVAGLGIPRGVTLIVGGGYHGKSTLLRALERGVYAHVPGDGRERVVTRPDAVKIRAEDGRRVVGCDIHPFVSDLPHGRSTAEFTSDDASGSTSQAANIVEAIEAGAQVLLLDEDTSATNFMVRDARMQALVGREREPITPFVDRVRELHDLLDVSTVLVMGGCGDYFDVADQVIEMHDFLPGDVTTRAREVARRFGRDRASDAREPLRRAPVRVPRAASIDPSRGRHDAKVDVRDAQTLGLGSHAIDLRAVEQIVDPSQTRAIGWALVRLRDWMDAGTGLPQLLDALEARLDEDGLESLTRRANLARPRRFEVAAALNRLRTLALDPA